MQNLEFEHAQSNSATHRTDTENSSIISNGHKRKTPDHSDDNSSVNGSNETFVVKRSRMNDMDTVASNIATTTADVASEATNDDNIDQNQGHFDNYMTDDNSNNEQNDRVSSQHNGKLLIHSDEAFQQGYVVVIPSMYPHLNYSSFPITKFLFTFRFFPSSANNG